MSKKYIVPVPNGISRGWGGAARHNGIDYLSPMGTPVKASGDGVIQFEGWGQNHSWITWMGGISILIRHDDGYSGYAHLSRTIIDNGQRVKQGQVIGYTGTTGNSTGPHLHFEFLPLNPNFANGYSGRVNPSSYFAKSGKPRTATEAQVKKAYLDILERKADAGGIRTYTTNGMTESQVRRDLLNSSEYKRLQNRKKKAAEKAAAEAKRKADEAARKAAEAARKAEEEATRKAEEEARKAAEEEAKALEEARERELQLEQTLELVRENSTRLERLLEIVKQILNKLTSIFK